MWTVFLVIFLISALYRPIWWNKLYTRARLVLACLSFYTFYKVPSQDSIVRCKQELNKIPKHAALIFNEKRYRSSSLAEIITWFSSLGIETVTFYSQNGVEEMAVHKIFNSLKNRFNGEINLDGNKITLVEMHHEHSQDGSIRKESRLEVIFIDKGYGKPLLTKLATKVVSESQNEDSLTADEFHKVVVEEVAFTPPELAVVFGPVFSTCGYPPWHLQFTEIHHFFSHQYIQWGQVQEVLKTFANTKQNYGK